MIIFKQKLRFQSSNQFKTRLFQSLPFALPGIVGVVIGFLGKGSPELFGISLLITICAPTVGIYLGAKQSAKIPQQLQDIANQFKIDYVCPKVGHSWVRSLWESLKNRKHAQFLPVRPNGERMSLFFSYSETASFVHETQMFDYKRE